MMVYCTVAIVILSIKSSARIESIYKLPIDKFLATFGSVQNWELSSLKIYPKLHKQEIPNFTWPKLGTNSLASLVNTGNVNAVIPVILSQARCS